MQLATDSATPAPVSGYDFSAASSPQDSRYSQYKIIRRNGSVVAFEPNKVSIAMTKAFIAVNGGQGAASARVREVVARLTDDVVSALIRRQPVGGTFHIEDIQDQVELALMRSGEHDVARSYVLYREERTRERAKQKEKATAEAPVSILHVLENGRKIPLDMARLSALI
jgi:ribonucleoside-diphosphate reductase alpha chain